MKLPELDERFDGGEEISANVYRLAKQARQLGVARQSLIKIWIAERLR